MEFKTKEVEELKAANQRAKGLLKRGEFRQLAQELQHTVLQNAVTKKFFDLDQIPATGEKNHIVKAEILRYKVLSYQILDYYDWLSPAFPCSKKDLGQAASEFCDHLDDLKVHSVSKDEIRHLGTETLEEVRNIGHDGPYWTGLSEAERSWWLERIWVTTLYSGLLFRENSTHQALGNLEVMLRIAEAIATPIQPKNATRAYIYESMAKCYWHDGDYRKAEDNYYLAVQHYRAKTSTLESENRPKKDIGDARRYMFRRIAQVYAHGLQEIQSAKSDLRRSEASLQIAELLLMERQEDDLTHLSIDLAKLINQRIKAGKHNRDQLRIVELGLIKLRDSFQRIPHTKLTLKCIWELAITKHLLDENEESEELIAVFRSYYEKISSDQPLANVHTLLSHVRRSKNDLQLAVHEAQLAVVCAKKSGNAIAKKDAYIALGESAFHLERSSGRSLGIDALDAFNHARKINGPYSNRKIEAICLLGVCKVSAIHGDRELAEQSWQAYESIKNEIEYQFIFDMLESPAKKELVRISGDFSIKNPREGGISGFSYKDHVDSLREWLYFTAKERNQSKEELAEKLGISRQTLYQWEKDIFER